MLLKTGGRLTLSACFDAVYVPEFGTPSFPATLDMSAKQPRPLAAKCGTMRRLRWTTENTFWNRFFAKFFRGKFRGNFGPKNCGGGGLVFSARKKVS
jgi:hypothetical protein